MFQKLVAFFKRTNAPSPKTRGTEPARFIIEKKGDGAGYFIFERDPHSSFYRSKGGYRLVTYVFTYWGARLSVWSLNRPVKPKRQDRIVWESNN